MLSKKNIIILLFQVLFCYSIFDHTQDLKISSSTYIASLNTENLYNFYNPACNGLNENKYLYSSYGSHFDGILKNQSIYFSINSNSFKKINFSIIRSSIDDIYNTTSAWNDNGDGIIDVSEIDYDNITTFSHNTIGFIISKSFSLKNKYKILPSFLASKLQYGFNSKFSFSSVASERSFSHSFDLGAVYYSSKFSDSNWISNIGLLVKDLFPYSYWSTGQIENKESLIIFGSSFGFKNNFSKSKSNYFYFSSDFNLSDLKNPSIGFEYQFEGYNSLISCQINSSNIENSLGFILRFKNQLNISYAFIIPENSELSPSQKIMIGINRYILNNYIK